MGVSLVVGCKNKKHGYRYLKQHYFAWFPKLPGYEVYNRKLDKYHEALTYIVKMSKNRLTMPQPAIAQIDTARLRSVGSNISLTPKQHDRWLRWDFVLQKRNIMWECE